MEDLILLPAPRQLERLSGAFPLLDRQFIRLNVPHPGDLLMAARVVANEVTQAAGWTWQTVAGGPAENVAVSIALDKYAARPQGYRLTISPDGIQIGARDPAGAFYAAQTLVQIVRQFPREVPALRIEDSPDFPARGVMLDISRDKVPTMQTLYAMVDELAAMKINQLQLYTEHTFAYRNHPVVWAQASPMTGEEILELDAYCKARFIELVPNQNSFGHLERWLKHPKYLPLAEAPEGFDTPWGHRDGPFSLCPIDPGSIALVESIFEELLPHFSSRMFNVGCDETFDIGQGRSKDECSRRGRERIYLDFLLKVHELVRKHGRTMQFWGDIILHKPELIGQLPKDIIALEWGYEADHPFDRDGALFKQAGVPFYVCPGTSTWLSIAGRTDSAIGNLKNAAENGLKHGAIGYLNTDWGDWGHLQYLPVSYLGFAAGAAYSWSWDANRELDVPRALDRHVFRDASGIMGRLAWDLGNVYRKINGNPRNSTLLFWKLVAGKDREMDERKLRVEECDAARAAIAEAMKQLSAARMDRPDAALIADEFRNAAAMLHFAVRRARWQVEATLEHRGAMADQMARITGEHRRLWLARNREGGLADSVRRLEQRVDEFR